MAADKQKSNCRKSRRNVYRLLFGKGAASTTKREFPKLSFLDKTISSYLEWLSNFFEETKDICVFHLQIIKGE